MFFEPIQQGSRRLLDCIVFFAFLRTTPDGAFASSFSGIMTRLGTTYGGEQQLASSTSAGLTGSSFGLSPSFWVYLELEQEASGLLLGTRALIIITY